MKSPVARRTGLHLLNPTISPFAGNNLGSQPGASAAGGPPVGEGGDLGGGVKALEEFRCGLGRGRTSGAAD
ncbi:hypothetical protein KBY74_10450 [Cyanobium sp. A1C-AMD]|uniref:hypothetical protein n=1 Tax=Cyanobium sp. A1C-AMD TaxID=2823694 RepID=UPI0020CDBEFA|nr:hypothetical protein [Cyanobium sp. A1C-AMD]MCP9880269.1 hypothetical protein [Cyanobium sp. A1C-AMD]